MYFHPLRSYDNYIQANLQLSLLKQHGISCHLADEHTVTIDPLLSPAIGGMKLMVMDTDLDRAQALLDGAEDEYLKSIPCVACGAYALERRTHVSQPGKWSKLLARLRGSSDSVLHRQIICSSCGKLQVD